MNTRIKKKKIKFRKQCDAKRLIAYGIFRIEHIKDYKTLKRIIRYWHEMSVKGYHIAYDTRDEQLLYRRRHRKASVRYFGAFVYSGELNKQEVNYSNWGIDESGLPVCIDYPDYQITSQSV